MFSIALFLCRNAADAADITQEVFLKLFLNLREFSGNSKFETWLYRIVANTAADHGRKLRRRLIREAVFWWHRPVRTPSIEETQVRRQIDESVRSAVASLPDKLRVCIVLRYVENLGYDEIADVLGCPSGTIAARLSRAHRMLALKLAKVKG